VTVSDYAENKLLDAIFNSTTTGGGLPTANPYVALHTADPGETGANEATGGSYARQQADFAAAASGTLQNNANIDFASMPAVTGNGIVGWSVWDAVSAGNCLWTGWLSLVSGLAEVRAGSDVTNNDVQSVAHGLATDNRVVFEALEGLTIPAGLTAGTLYFVIATGLTTDAFRVATTSGGAAIDITAAGSALWRLVGNKTVNSGDTFRIATGDLDVFLD
jgi:hypothetical protein